MKVVSKILDSAEFKNSLPTNISVDDQWLFKTHTNTFIHEVKLYAGKNIFFLPEHIIFDGLKMWRKELTNHYTGSFVYRIKRIIKALLRKTIHLKGKYALITDDWSWSYFHWTGDVLPRLYLIKNKLTEYTVLIPAHFKNYSYITESLAKFNAKIYFFPADKNLKIEELIVPSPVGSSGIFNHSVMRNLSQFIKDDHNITNTDTSLHYKIYISRSKAKYRKILNEDEVIEVLRHHGFMILNTEGMTLDQQIKIVADCRWLISIHGAGLTNELYLTEGANVMEIRHPTDHLNNCYYLMATALNLHYYYFLGQPDNEDPHYANLTVNISSFTKSITQFLLN